MRCAGFEHGLVEFLEGPPDRDETEALLKELRAHADACPDCAGSTDLLRVLELPRGERDPVPDPGQAYWDDFDRRLRDRLQGSSATAFSQRRRWLSIAAAVVFLVVGGWVSWRLVPGEAPPAAAVKDALPQLLERSLAEAGPEEAMGHLDDLAGWTAWEADSANGRAEPGAWGEGGLFPDVSDLDADARQELLLWLRGQTS